MLMNATTVERKVRAKRIAKPTHDHGRWMAFKPGHWAREFKLPLTARLHVPGEDGRLWDASVPVGTRWRPFIPRANFLILEQG